MNFIPVSLPLIVKPEGKTAAAHRIAMEMIAAEAVKRDAKLDRLRGERLAREAAIVSELPSRSPAVRQRARVRRAKCL